jgi:galactokinase
MNAMELPNDQVKAQFLQVFGQLGDPASPAGKLHVVRAPGRVNLIGEHTDYNDGFVLPMAIEPEVKMVCRLRDDMRVRLASDAFRGQFAEFSLEQKITRGEPAWANYSRGVAAELLDAGVPLTGMDALITNTLPVGGGLSSSAAIEVATACCFLALGGLDIDMQRLAIICQKAEHEYAGVPVGIMDQTAVIASRANHAMLLDCRDLSKQFVPIDAADVRIVIVNSMVKHELTGGEYAQRRRQCEEGVRFFQQTNPAVRALRDVAVKQVDDAAGKLDDVVFRRCRHVVSENARTTEAAKLLGRKEYDKVGQLMAASHKSLRDDYNVSIPELDFLSERAMAVEGVYGARMTGGGFGGCIVALAQPAAVGPLAEQIASAYHAKFGKTPMIFPTRAMPGASIL